MEDSNEMRDVVIIGGGQAGLAMSHLLTQQRRDHVVLEKGDRIGDTWRRRWDSFTLVTPNWMLQLPGFPYKGNDPDGFLSRDEIVEYLEAYAESFDPPIQFGTEVTAVERIDDADRYRILTSEGDIESLSVVIATGTFQHPHIPEMSAAVPSDIFQLHSDEYRNPGALPDGSILVVGSAQSGCQIALELKEHGRDVHLATGRVGRFPRTYRTRDGAWWAQQLGMLDQTHDQLDDPAERFAPNPQASGRDGGQDIDLHRFARNGMALHGHLEDVRKGVAHFADDLHEHLAMADEMTRMFRDGVDEYVEQTGMSVPEGEVVELRDGYEQGQISELDLADARISTVVWATGYCWDFGWVDLPVLDDHGYPIQDQGVTASPGLYFLGLSFMHRAKSGLFFGVGEDAMHVAGHLAGRTPASLGVDASG